jgi:hypothetical protein
MRPRRPFRRNMLRRLPPFPPSGAGAPPQLVQANQLFLNARYVPAGERYAALAAGAEQLLLPQAAHLYFQAGRAFLLAHHPERAEQLAQQGLHLLAVQGRMRQLAHLGPRVVWEFEHQGHRVEAARLSAWLNTIFSPGTMPGSEASQANLSASQTIPFENMGAPVAAPIAFEKIGRSTDAGPDLDLPRLCPSCGAPVDPRDVDWVDDNTPMCAFCAIPLLGNE